MIPISKAYRLPQGININPFDIYILVPEAINIFTKNQENNIENKLMEIWNGLSFLPAVFKLRFIEKYKFLKGFEDDQPLYRIFKNCNIFASVIGSRSHYVKLETGNVALEDDIENVQIELFLFILQLCKADIELIQDFRMQVEYNSKIENITTVLKYLNEIERNFLQIENYLKEKLKGEYLYRIQSRKKLSYYRSSLDLLNIVSLPVFEKLRETNGTFPGIPEMASAIGIHVPESQPKEDDNIEIEIREDILKSKYPSIVFKKGDSVAYTKHGYKEGMLQYVFSLLNHIASEKQAKCEYSVAEMDYIIEKYVSFLNEDKEMDLEFKYLLEKYKNIYDCLFLREDENNNSYYVGPANQQEGFKAWCKKYQNKKYLNQRFRGRMVASKNPFYQGISNVRGDIKECLKEKQMSDIYDKVDLSRKIEDHSGNDFHKYIKKSNIFFPKNKRWEKLGIDESHFRDFSIIE